MIRILTIALALAVLAPTPALADDPAPTPEQIEQAKKAFAEGKKLHEAGKHAEAIEKFKESYRLSKNPLLLYNIGFTMDEAKEADMALFYYRKFLKEAPADAPQRASVVDRVKVLEQQFNPNAGQETTPVAVPTKPDKPEPRAPVVIKPVGTYGAGDFEHQVIETAPPAKPLDITAFVPEDSGFVVTLFFRTAGEGKFTSKVMKWRYKELVGRVPPAKMIGNAVQYYIEVKDTEGNVVTRNGKATSPNLVNLEAGATPRFYPDLSEDGEVQLSAAEVRRREVEDDDPLNRKKKREADPEPITKKKEEVIDDTPKKPGTGPFDVGSSSYGYIKWSSSGVAVAGLTAAVFGYFQAKRYATALEDDANKCRMAPNDPPCRNFDSFAADFQSTGKFYQTLGNVGLGIGIAGAAVAGVYWYRELSRKRPTEVNAATAKTPSPEATSWQVAPVLGADIGGMVGATAARRF